MRAGDRKASSARWKAFIASIVDAAHLPISELARLTRRQLVEIYAHPRDEEGRIKTPSEAETVAEQPPSLERDMAQLMVIAGVMRMGPEKYAKLKEQIEAKWAAKKEESSDG